MLFRSSMEFIERVKLKENEKLVKTGEFKAGHLGQKEREYYDILNENDEKVGSLVYKEYSDTKPPFHTSYRITKYNLNNEVIHSDSWE